MNSKFPAFVFARGGSKGLPNKNILPFAGKPLIAWAIEHALGANWIDEVFVSTDSIEIASVAEKYGAQVPFLRPSTLATDESPEWDSWMHALNFLRNSNGVYPDAFVSVPATSPLRESGDIDKCIELFNSEEVDAVITYTDSHRNPYFNMLSENSKKHLTKVIQGPHLWRRQDAPVVYDMATVAYVISSEFALQSSSLFQGRVKGVHIPSDRAIDIDNKLDFDFAEFLMTRKEAP
jgi:N-acylneuraminate cytidylyltransferase